MFVVQFKYLWLKLLKKKKEHLTLGSHLLIITHLYRKRFFKRFGVLEKNQLSWAIFFGGHCGCRVGLALLM